MNTSSFPREENRLLPSLPPGRLTRNGPGSPQRHRERRGLASLRSLCLCGEPFLIVFVLVCDAANGSCLPPTLSIALLLPLLGGGICSGRQGTWTRRPDQLSNDSYCGSQRGWSAPWLSRPRVRQRALCPAASILQMPGASPAPARQNTMCCPSGDSLARKSQSAGSLCVSRVTEPSCGLRRQILVPPRASSGLKSRLKWSVSGRCGWNSQATFAPGSLLEKRMWPSRVHVGMFDPPPRFWRGP